MPDPWHYLQAIAISALISGWIARNTFRSSDRAAKVAGFTASLIGAMTGLARLGWLPSLSPVTALDRLLVFVVPAVAAWELGCVLRGPSRFDVAARWLIALLLGPTVLFGSIYLTPSVENWNFTIRSLGMATGGTALAFSWIRLSDWTYRTGDRGIALWLSSSMATAGIAMLVTGYLRGGITSMVIAAAVGLASPKQQSSVVRAGVTGLAWMTHIGLLIVGSFFGRMGVVASVALAVAPLIYCQFEMSPGNSEKSFGRRVSVRIAAGSLLLIAFVHAVVSGSFLSLR